MIRWSLIFVTATALWALPFESYAKYKAGYGFMTLGESVAVLKIAADGSYETEVTAKATGLAATVTGNRVESYKSIGRMVEGRLVPERFETRFNSNSRHRFRRYEIDHTQRQVTEIREDCKRDKCTNSSKKLEPDKYAPDDILTLFHNITWTFARSGAKEVTAPAVGSKEAVRVLLPEGNRLKTAQRTFDGKGGLYLVVVLNQEIFSSSEGELYINLDADRVASKAVLKKTLLFGDVWGELIEKKTKGKFDAGSY